MHAHIMFLNKARGSRILRDSMLAVAFTLAFSTSSKALARDFFVSPAGNNGDGQTWQSAWKELDQIRFTQLAKGDTVYIDGGPSASLVPFTYRKSLIVPEFVNGVRFALAASDTNHNGRVILDGGGTGQQFGIAISGTNNTIDGGYQSGISVRNFSFAGVQTFPTSGGNVVKNLDVRNNLIGINASGRNNFDSNAIHDNLPVNFYQNQPSGLSDDVVLSNSWVYNQLNPSSNPYLFGILSQPNVNGNLRISHCVIGPRLGFGLSCYSSCNVILSDVLMLNSAYSNIYLDSSVPRCDITKLTSFMTPLNFQGQAHNAITSKSSSLAISNSIYFGGQVVLNPGRYGSNTTQFGVTGNTTALADSEIDPRFVAEANGQLDRLSNDASLDSLWNLDFSLAPDSRSIGQGTSIKRALPPAVF